MHQIVIPVIVLLAQLILAPTNTLAATERPAVPVPSEDTWRRPDVVLEALDPKPGETVVDLGAGSGYYVGPLANLVGRRGTVYATDIDDDALRGLEGLKATHGFNQMIIIRSAHQSPRLPANSVNAVLISHTLRELKDPVPFLVSLKQSLRRNGRVVVVDFLRTDDGFAPSKGSRLDLAEAKRVLVRAGFRISEVKQIPRQYLLICEPN